MFQRNTKDLCTTDEQSLLPLLKALYTYLINNLEVKPNHITVCDLHGLNMTNGCQKLHSSAAFDWDTIISVPHFVKSLVSEGGGLYYAHPHHLWHR